MTAGTVDLVRQMACFSCANRWLSVRDSGCIDRVLVSGSPGDDSLELPLALISFIFCDEVSLSFSVTLFCGWFPLSAW